MKKIILLSLICASNFVMGQNIVYKCVDSEGMVSYQNSSDGKDLKCEKTSLGNVENFNTYKAIPLEKKDTPKEKDVAKNTNNLNFESSNSDEGRKKILIKELGSEKDELSTTISMIENLKKSLVDKFDEKISQQIKQLQDLKTAHENNILSLEKELGLNKNVTNNLKVTKPN